MPLKKWAILVSVYALAGVAWGYCENQLKEKPPAPTVHVVEEGETVWSLARPIADRRGEDIRDTICQLMADNDIGIDAVIYPGQKIVIK